MAEPANTKSHPDLRSGDRSDDRILMRNLIAIEWAAGGAVVGAYPIVFTRHTPATIALVALTAIGVVGSLAVPWQRLSKNWFLPMIWIGTAAVYASPWIIRQPAMIIFLFAPMVILTSFFWERRVLVLSHVAVGSVIGAVVPVLYSGFKPAVLGPVFAALPVFLLVVMVVGVLANRVLSTQALRERLESTIEALSGALQARDGYTGSHSSETVELVRTVAAELTLDEGARRYVTDVALLHDIGKLGVPDSILNSPDKLTDAEWEVMRRHPEIGEEIVQRVPGMETVAKAIRHEHERWDGGGYPDGLAGNEIPLASRIVLVCDAYHAMTSNRPYRDAMPDDDARAELIRHAGAQFDPRVVDALLRSLDRRDARRDDDAAQPSRSGSRPGEIAGAPENLVVERRSTFRIA